MTAGWPDVRRFLFWWVGTLAVSTSVVMPIFVVFWITTLPISLPVFAGVIWLTWRRLAKPVTLHWWRVGLLLSITTGLVALAIMYLHFAPPERGSGYSMGGGVIIRQDGVLTAEGRRLSYLWAPLWFSAFGLVSAGVAWVRAFQFAPTVHASREEAH